MYPFPPPPPHTPTHPTTEACEVGGRKHLGNCQQLQRTMFKQRHPAVARPAHPAALQPLRLPVIHPLLVAVGHSIQQLAEHAARSGLLQAPPRSGAAFETRPAARPAEQACWLRKLPLSVQQRRPRAWAEQREQSAGCRPPSCVQPTCPPSVPASQHALFTQSARRMACPASRPQASPGPGSSNKLQATGCAAARPRPLCPALAFMGPSATILSNSSPPVTSSMTMKILSRLDITSSRLTMWGCRICGAAGAHGGGMKRGRPGW